MTGEELKQIEKRIKNKNFFRLKKDRDDMAALVAEVKQLKKEVEDKRLDDLEEENKRDWKRDD